MHSVCRTNEIKVFCNLKSTYVCSNILYDVWVFNSPNPVWKQMLLKSGTELGNVMP